MPPTIKLGTIIQETLTLQRDLLNGLKISELDRWIGDSDIREAVLRNMIFGRIRWPKSVGKSVSATLNQGFTICHWSTYIGIAEGQDGPVVTTNTAALPEPYKFDWPDDSDHYSVGFFAQVQILFPQRIQPTFASSVAWPYVLNHYRLIDPFDWSGSEINQLVIIPDFTVSLQLY
jgi:hypothetical protein